MAASFNNPSQYDSWYDQYPNVFAAEIHAIEAVLPRNRRFLEVGVGTGRFASALNVSTGIDLSAEMLSLSDSRGINCIRGDTEKLPFGAASFQGVLFVTVICFLADPVQSFKEARRALIPGGQIIVAFINRLSLLGQQLTGEKNTGTFADAVLYSEQEVVVQLKQAGFHSFKFVNTLHNTVDQISSEEPIMSGAGNGGFVVVLAESH